jgi:N6-L-threonylcarbamoyladenine synthase
MPDAFILGIESSCDETGAAVVRSGQQILSNVVFSQIATHMPYGGVVPELASREHLRAIVPVVRKALADAGHTYQSLDALAVTQGPGLAGALLVGLSYAKALAFALEKPLIAVNHLEGHIHAVLLEERQKGNHELNFPVLALVVSGGHTHLYLAEQKEAGWSYENIGHTRDDAAGEAFDKVAKLLGLGYPGGPIIDRLAPHGNPGAVKFAPSQIKHPDRKQPRQPGSPRFDFSYSGIKTAVLRYVETHTLAPSIDKRRQALAAIPKPKLEDYLAQCDPETRRSLRGRHSVRDRRRRRQQRIAPEFRTRRCPARLAGLLPVSPALHRQRRHDRRRRLSQMAGKGFCGNEFFCGGRSALAPALRITSRRLALASRSRRAPGSALSPTVPECRCP